MASARYRWYLAAQALSLAGTTMSYTALFWLAVHIPQGGAAALAAVDAAQCLPMLLVSRRAGLLVARHRAARILVMTQTLQVAGALAIGVPLLAGWMTIWYLVPLSFAVGCVLCVDLPARQTFGIGGNYWSSRRKDPGPREFLAWAVVCGAAESLAAVMPSAWLYDAAMVVTGAAPQLFTVSATVYIQQATPAAQRGLALSAYNAGFIGFVPGRGLRRRRDRVHGGRPARRLSVPA